MQHRPRHPEVDQQSPSRFEPNNQILAAPVHELDPLALELPCDPQGIERPRQPRIDDLDALEAAPGEHGREPAAHGLHLGQLGHASTVVHASCVTPRMHVDELDVPESLVRGLVDEQFPQWAEAPLARVPVWGTDNAMYRLGGDLVVRLPRRAQNVGGLAKELTWLPRLAPHLPVRIPEPVGVGAPGNGYPWRWAVYRWLAGTPALEAASV